MNRRKRVSCREVRRAVGEGGVAAVPVRLRRRPDASSKARARVAARPVRGHCDCGGCRCAGHGGGASALPAAPLALQALCANLDRVFRAPGELAGDARPFRSDGIHQALQKGVLLGSPRGALDGRVQVVGPALAALLCRAPRDVDRNIPPVPGTAGDFRFEDLVLLAAPVPLLQAWLQGLAPPASEGQRGARRGKGLAVGRTSVPRSQPSKLGRQARGSRGNRQRQRPPRLGRSGAPSASPTPRQPPARHTPRAHRQDGTGPGRGERVPAWRRGAVLQRRRGAVKGREPVEHPL